MTHMPGDLDHVPGMARGPGRKRTFLTVLDPRRPSRLQTPPNEPAAKPNSSPSLDLSASTCTPRSRPELILGGSAVIADL